MLNYLLIREMTFTVAFGEKKKRNKTKKQHSLEE
jgi:hypothetical protein